MSTRSALVIITVVAGIVFVIFNISNPNTNPSQPPLMRGGENPPDKGDVGGYVTVGSVKVLVDVADTPALREQGLSGRKSLEKGEGMLFVFDTPGIYSFWMKDMNFPIDIIWINQNKKIVYIKENVTPGSFPQAFASTENAQYVLEVPAGFSARNNVQVGDIIDLVY